ncbi:N-acetylglucosamine kinase [Agromyces silvae]|uniref:N-acetylglucosamine kinase n=1 Tax=Agromyces silvae TaxID=3388266 RepID=UPI00359F877A
MEVDGVRRMLRHTGYVDRRNGRIDEDALTDRIARLLHPVMSVGGAGIERLVIGTTGVPDLVDSDVLALRVRDELRCGAVLVVSDVLTTHVGALGGRPGAVIAAGTGAIGYATDHVTVERRVDGWGYLLGDEGSGAWIGAAGLRAALCAADGRSGGSETLLQALLGSFGSTDDLIDAVYSSATPGSFLAGFTPTVAAAATTCGVAAGIWNDAGAMLARNIHAISQGVPPHFSWGGGLFDVGDLLIRPFRQELGRLAPGAEVSAPRGSAAAGALALARGDASTHVGRAAEFAWSN